VSEELKACFYCEAQTAPVVLYEDMVPLDKPMADYRLRYYYVFCQKCRAQGSVSTDRKEAIAAWNMRPGGE